jgi:ATP-binding cassette subfamily C protein CydCD
VERLLSHDVAFARLGRRRAKVYAGLIPRVPGPRIRRRGELLSRVVDDVDADVDGLLRGRLPAASAVIAAILVAGAAVRLLPAAGVPLVAGLLTAGVAAPALAARLAARREAATGRARAELRDAVVETVDGIEELAVRGDGALAVPVERSQVLARLEARAARAAGLAAGLAHLGWGVAVTGTALVLSRSGDLSPEWAAVLLLAVVALAEPVFALPDAALARQRAIGARSRLAALTSSAPPTARPGARLMSTMDGGLRVRGLTVGWDPDRPAVIDGLDLDIPRGGSLALTGVSGSGKSTLAAVLAGLLEPRAGTIYFGGSVVLVGDGTDHVFASTVRENLRLAKPGATDDELAGVLERAGLAGWDLDAWLGTGGTTVSGGQRKRLATARALLARPDLLILDEPTEGLDQAGAEALMADLLGAAGGRTVLILTHRTEGLDRVGATYSLSRCPVVAST